LLRRRTSLCVLRALCALLCRTTTAYFGTTASRTPTCCLPTICSRKASGRRKAAAAFRRCHRHTMRGASLLSGTVAADVGRACRPVTAHLRHLFAPTVRRARSASSCLPLRGMCRGTPAFVFAVGRWFTPPFFPTPFSSASSLPVVLAFPCCCWNVRARYSCCLSSLRGRFRDVRVRVRAANFLRFIAPFLACCIVLLGSVTLVRDCSIWRPARWTCLFSFSSCTSYPIDVGYVCEGVSSWLDSRRNLLPCHVAHIPILYPEHAVHLPVLSTTPLTFGCEDVLPVCIGGRRYKRYLAFYSTRW
jgi:hypothetical protein